MRKLLAAPPGAVAIALGTVVAGFLWPLALDKGWTSAATPYWAAAGVAVFILGVMVAVRDGVRDAMAEGQHRQLVSANEELVKTTRQLPEIVSTMPTTRFMDAVNVNFEKAYVVSVEASSKEQVETALSIALMAVAQAASTFDCGRPSDGPGLCANIMWFVPKSHELAAAWDEKVVFRAPGVSLEKVQGLLVLSKKFSATTDVSPDPDLPEFAFDVPEDPVHWSGSGEKFNVLPGAPAVFARGMPLSYFHPATDIGAWMKERGNFVPSVTEDVVAYFRTASQIAGFMSLPVYRLSPNLVESVDREIIGVLNLHWGHEVTLLRHAAAQKLAEAIYPLRALVADMMFEYLHRHGGPPGRSE